MEKSLDERTKCFRIYSTLSKVDGLWCSCKRERYSLLILLFIYLKKLVSEGYLQPLSSGENSSTTQMKTNVSMMLLLLKNVTKLTFIFFFLTTLTYTN